MQVMRERNFIVNLDLKIKKMRWKYFYKGVKE